MAITRLQIIRPETIEKAYACGGYGMGSNYNACYSTAYVSTGDSIRTTQYENNEYFFRDLPHHGNRTMAFLTKIPGGAYRKLYADMSVDQESAQLEYNRWSITLNSTGILTGEYDGNYQGTNFKKFVLVHADWTPAQINSQQDIIINSTDQRNLARQTIVMNIGDISSDFWICTHMCQAGARIWNLYADVE